MHLADNHAENSQNHVSQEVSARKTQTAAASMGPTVCLRVSQPRSVQRQHQHRTAVGHIGATVEPTSDVCPVSALAGKTCVPTL